MLNKMLLPTAETLRSTIVTIGNFDGVHTGHQALLSATHAYAHERDLPSLAITFDPHPVFVLPQRGECAPLPRLTDIAERVRLLKSYGMTDVLVLPFTLALAATSPADFFKSILWQTAGAQAVFLGYDFALGRDRVGCINTLMALGASFDIVMQRIESINWHGVPISSSRIRQCLQDGVVEDANAMLGRPYRLKGSVAHGHGRGSTIGIPTANLAELATLIPKNGVYATLAQYIDAQGHVEIAPAVTNIGLNPTFADSATPKLSVETHIIGRDVELYGKELSIDFIAHIRDEQKFPSAEALVAQIRADMEAASLCLRNSL